MNLCNLKELGKNVKLVERGNMEYIQIMQSPLGKLTASSDGDNITGLWFENQKYYAATLEKENEVHDLFVFQLVKKWLDLYFAGSKPDFSIPVAPKGSLFRQAVWKILRTIPYGEIVTYGDIARQLKKTQGMNTSARAVGGAVGHNPISILIPCHRVIGAKGKLTGYAGGIDKKVQLLKLEHVSPEKLCMP